jgi:hypothetical protein
MTLDQDYRGQAFSLVEFPLWDSIPPNFPMWLVFRQAPTSAENVILWVNLDSFPDDDANADYFEFLPEDMMP